jgi:hypothetical protein
VSGRPSSRCLAEEDDAARDSLNGTLPAKVPPPNEFLDPRAVARRAEAFPRVAAAVGSNLTDVLAGTKPRRARAAARLLDILERDGDASGAFLGWLESGLVELDALAPEGWETWQRRLGRARIGAFPSFVSEFAVMRWLIAQGAVLLAVDPPADGGRRADLLVRGQEGVIALEVSTPTPAKHDWVERVVDELFERLQRIPTGLLLEIEGYEAFTRLDSGTWEQTTSVGSDGVSRVISTFRRAAAEVDKDSLPATLVHPDDAQPLTIVAREWNPEAAEGTDIIGGWDRSLIVPDVERLVEKILAERDQLPTDKPGAVLVDLAQLADFRSADYYLTVVRERLKERSSLPCFVGTFVTWTASPELLIERSTLHVDEGVPAGADLAALWDAPGVHTNG